MAAIGDVIVETGFPTVICLQVRHCPSLGRADPFHRAAQSSVQPSCLFVNDCSMKYCFAVYCVADL